MATQKTSRAKPRTSRSPKAHSPLQAYDTVALLLQGGGALGSYQAGVYEGLSQAGIEPTWLAGISIGAINTALIAGNAPEHRVNRLREFWETVCQPAFFPLLPPFAEQALFNHSTDQWRKLFTAYQATQTLIEGQQGFFVPRFPSPPTIGGTDPTTASYYDTAPLKATLERLCDFDRINQGDIRVSVGAVNVRNGNFVYFDNHGRDKTTLRAEHFMASGALPPGFAAVEIDGEFYWDGGLVSNTPLDRLVRVNERDNTLAFQVDLWSAQGHAPNNMLDVSNRMKDIQYSSRTRLITDQLQRTLMARKLIRELLNTIPETTRKKNRWCQLSEQVASDQLFNIVHLIYRGKEYEGHYKDFQFGLTTMQEHWSSGLTDITHSLKQPGWLEPPSNESGFVTHDIHRIASE